MSETRDPKYSWVFQKLTENDQGQFNLESIVAYTIYKKHKIDFIDEIKTKKGREPNKVEWETFHTTCESDASLATFRSHASTIVIQLLDIALSDEISSLEDLALLDSKVKAELAVVNTKLTTIDGYINEKQGLSWWLSEVGKNFVVNVLTIILVGGLATLFINFNKILDWFKSLGA
ncbi:hypothetical protein [Acinetobacter pseudolwoffii]|uniref:Uncharacterized protein n=1 Tax=Acinetobacter pseudolwoffii TaxID=2053287 RepID=A0A2H9UMZ6_9GAMM|nr:hypothetical protein [Acinetobacter pseudolwoffii]PJI33020.1 hypothetical protein CU320_05060 [Acinetobacter pseudolwoffii]